MSFATIPFEILIEICDYLHPSDLYTLKESLKGSMKLSVKTSSEVSKVVTPSTGGINPLPIVVVSILVQEKTVKRTATAITQSLRIYLLNIKLRGEFLLRRKVVIQF